MRWDQRVSRRMRKIVTAARYGTTEPHTAPPPPAQVEPAKRRPASLTGVDYEGAWDKYARSWRERFPDAKHLGDEWQGTEAGAARNIDEYIQLIDRKFIEPYVEPDDHVLEIGVGGGRTALLLRNRAAHVTCADISGDMLRVTRERLGDDRMTYVKLDGRTLDGIPEASIDVLFCFDTLVHVEPRDIFNYLVRVPPLMRGRRLVLLHHGNVLTERGWERFVREYGTNLMGRSGAAFSVMTDSIMERFLDHLGYEILVKDTDSVPRDCAWVVRAPEPQGRQMPALTSATSESLPRHSRRLRSSVHCTLHFAWTRSRMACAHAGPWRTPPRALYAAQDAVTDALLGEAKT